MVFSFSRALECFEASVARELLSKQFTKRERDWIAQTLHSSDEYYYIFDIIEQDLEKPEEVADQYEVKRFSYPNKVLLVLNRQTNAGMRFEFWKAHFDLSVGQFDDQG